MTDNIKPTNKMIAICGLNCAECPAHVALIKNDDELREKTAQEWSKQFGHDFAAVDINCVGCREIDGTHGGYCHACPLRLCALGKKLSNCYMCAEFDLCQKRKEFETQTGMSIKNNFLEKKEEKE